MMCPPPLIAGAAHGHRGWLRSLGLGKYEAAFRENDIDETVLPSLTHETLKESYRRRDAEPCGASTSPRGTQQRGHRGEHTKARR